MNWTWASMQQSRQWFFAAATLIMSITVAFAQSSPQDYPQWRGPMRDGAASAFAAPKAWPEKLTRHWKVEVGEGYATPLVIGQIVYCFARRGDNEVMSALKVATGKILWQTAYPAPYKPGSPAAAHGAGPKSTPLFHHGKLYTLGISGIVSAFDAVTGKLIWQKPAPPEHPFFGAAVSPVGDHDLVIVHPGNYGSLTAFDEKTGEVRWTAEGEGSFASPIIVELSGVRQVVTMTQQSVVGLAVNDGKLLWQYPWMSSMTPSAITPILHGATIIVAGQKMPVAALKPTPRDGKWAVDVVWENKEVSLFLSNPVLVGDTLYGLSERASGQFFTLDVITGKVLWLGQPRAAVNAAIVKAGELLFLLKEDAELIVARSNRQEFTPLKRYTVAESATWAQSTISGGRIFIKDVTSLALWTLK